jgi:hypothetical protein
VKISYLPHAWQRKEDGNRTSVENSCRFGDMMALAALARLNPRAPIKILR